MLDEQHKYIHHFAINEVGELGFILEVNTLGATTIYLGLPIAGTASWLSLAPQVIPQKVEPEALVDVLMHLAPTKSGPPMMIPIRLPTTDKAMPGGNWDTFFTMGADSNIGDIFTNLMKPPTESRGKLPKASDFKVDSPLDNPDDDRDDGA